VNSGTVGVPGTLTLWSRGDHVHPSDTSRAPLANPVFTGDPQAVTQPNTDSDTSIATTAFVHSVRLDQMATPNTDVAWGSHKITGLLDPTNPQEAATKNYVDLTAQGLDAKASVRAATTANLAALSAPQTIDGVSLVAGDRVLVKDQTTQSGNGIYTVAAGAWVRGTDTDTWNELVAAFTFVENGTVNGDTGWLCTVDPGGTLNTTAVTWVQFSSAGVIIAGNGLTKTGSTIDVVGTANRIAVFADNIDIATTYVGQNSITTVGTISTGTWAATIGNSTLTGTLTNSGTISGGLISGATIDGSTLDCGTF
jgi:cytoskeletal protein RodZ